jgi:mercuric ion transport protein
VKLQGISVFVTGVKSSNNVRDRSDGKWLATASIVGAIVASSCCIAPLLFVSVGISGAWIGNLTALEPYKIYFLGTTTLFLGAGIWHLYFKRQQECIGDSYCSRPMSGLITKAALWIAIMLVIASATVDFWAPLFY